MIPTSLVAYDNRTKAGRQKIDADVFNQLKIDVGQSRSEIALALDLDERAASASLWRLVEINKAKVTGKLARARYFQVGLEDL